MRVPTKLKLVPVVLATAVSLVLTACGGPAASGDKPKETGGAIPTASSESLVDAATKEGSLVWYSSNTRPMSDALVGLFEKAYPGITVDLFQAGGSQVISKVEAEISADNVQADFVTYSEGSVAIDQANRGLLERYQPEHADDVVDGLWDPEGYYFATTFLSASIIYNTDIVSEADAPKSWDDLLDPKWKGKVGMASPDYAGTAVTTIATWDQKLGKDYIAKLGANDLQVLKGFGDVEQAVLSGQTPIAITLNFRAIADEVAGKPVKFITPKEGQIKLVSSAAIFAGCAHPNAAKLFANFLLSDDAQKLVSEAYYFPARAEIADSVKGMPDASKIKFIQGDAQKTADPTYIGEIKKAFNDATS